MNRRSLVSGLLGALGVAAAPAVATAAPAKREADIGDLRPEGVYANLSLREFYELRPEILVAPSKCGCGHQMVDGDVTFSRKLGLHNSNMRLYCCANCVTQSSRALRELHRHTPRANLYAVIDPIWGIK